MFQLFTLTGDISKLYNEKGEIEDSWFGGGSDLTPYYIFEEDGKHFHTSLKNAMDPLDLNYIPNTKHSAIIILLINTVITKRAVLEEFFMTICARRMKRSRKNDRIPAIQWKCILKRLSSCSREKKEIYSTAKKRLNGRKSGGEICRI